MQQNRKQLHALQKELGGKITSEFMEKKLEVCGFKVLYFGVRPEDKGDRTLELLQLKEQVIKRQAFTFPGGDGCDFVFVDKSLSEEDICLALLREWCHIRLEHPVTERIQGGDFHSQQEAACLAESLYRKDRSIWNTASICILLGIVLLLLIWQLVSMPIESGEQEALPAEKSTEIFENTEEALPDDAKVYITKEKFHRADCMYATDVAISREMAVNQGYARCQTCKP